MAETMKRTDSVFEQAIIFATKAHGGAKRKGTGIPYIVHPIEAAAIASTMTLDEEILAAAVLHDVLEDTDTTAEELEALFGLHVAELVQDETENKRRDRPAQETWRLRKQEMLDFLTHSAGREAKILALSDKLSNLRAIHRDLQMLGDRLWERFNEKDRHMHAWLYQSVADALEDLSEFAAFKEYSGLVKETFGENVIESGTEASNVTVFPAYKTRQKERSL